MSVPNHRCTTFLLGSGISIPSGYPSTAEITRELLAKNWLFERDEARSPVPVLSQSFGGVYPLRVEAIMGLLRILKSHVDQHLALHGKDAANYEDIYYLARQLLDGLRGEYDNPGLLPLMFELRTKASLMVENLNSIYHLDGIGRKKEKLGLEGLLDSAIHFIEESVAAQLAPREKIVGLGLLDQFLAIDANSPLHVATLNHDTLVETHLSKHQISDGFATFSPAAAKFDPKTLDDGRPFRVRLLKPHGSINWFRYKTADKLELDLKVLTNDPDHINGPDGEDLLTPQHRLLLAGTTNKELAYGSGIFLELMFQFHKRLKETNLLIVSGYGFADKGINNRLWAWLDSRPENRLLLLHNFDRLDELRQKAKPSLSFNWNCHKKTKKFLVVYKWMCDCSVDDINRELRIASR